MLIEQKKAAILKSQLIYGHLKYNDPGCHNKFQYKLVLFAQKLEHT